ncbi:hypothetical protein AX17_000450 [Amanita inopinata Kibby_2008]|nr:hypothetical protein AX17_000450 [Amanita inopinata Kibby_2008]
MSLQSFPVAQQAQIIRANQRDVYHISHLKEQTENVLRSWLGTRWLARWDKEVELLVKLLYYGFTTGRGELFELSFPKFRVKPQRVQATQTLGEEYTDVWQYSGFHRRLPPPLQVRTALTLLPALSHYLLAKWGQIIHASSRVPLIPHIMKSLPVALSIASEINLAMFYIRGAYYDVVKRALGIQYVCSLSLSPGSR